MTKLQLIDLLERLFWTLIQATSGFLVAFQTENVYLGILTAGAGAILKGVVAQQFGNGTAATVPSEDEAVYPEDADAVAGFHEGH